MGSTLSCSSDATVPYRASVEYNDGSAFSGGLQLISNGGEVFAETAGNVLEVTLPVGTEERCYFLRVNDAEGQSLAFAAPVWVRP
jgi:hypothetical protein